MQFQPTGQLQRATLRQAANPPASPEAIVYRLDLPLHPGTPFVIDLRVVRILKSGEWGVDRALPPTQLQNPTANYLTPVDRAILHLMRGATWNSGLQVAEDPEIVDLAMRRMIATGRCRWQDLASLPLKLGAPRGGRLTWRVGIDGRQTMMVALEDQPAVVLPSASPWYVLSDERLAGPVELDLARPLVRIALSSPPVTTAQAEAVGAALERDLPGVPLPRPRADLLEEICKDPPVPVLTLVSRKRGWNYWGVRFHDLDETVDLALLGFGYGGTVLDPDDRRGELRAFEDGRIIVRRRDRAAERRARKRLDELRLNEIEEFEPLGRDGGRVAYGFTEGPKHWPDFVYDGVPQLEREGWRVEFEDGFRHRVLDGARMDCRTRGERRLVVLARSRDRDRWRARCAAAGADLAAGPAPRPRAGRRTRFSGA